ncbi:MAG: hypothetical protein IPL31_17020 [Saprospiraceae bacterium]|nr:hypothetical protein [Saprospiraceae bacterium]
MISFKIRVDVVYLSSDDLQGRETGTEGEVMAAEYISKQNVKNRLKSKGNEDWLQPFKFSSNPHGGNVQDKTGRNVIGFLIKS